MKTQTSANSKYLIYEAMGKKYMSKFILTSGSSKRIRKQDSKSPRAYLTELSPYVVVLDLARLTHSYHLSYMYGQMF